MAGSSSSVDAAVAIFQGGFQGNSQGGFRGAFQGIQV
jgi:hypothetical protein